MERDGTCICLRLAGLSCCCCCFFFLILFIASSWFFWRSRAFSMLGYSIAYLRSTYSSFSSRRRRVSMDRVAAAARLLIQWRGRDRERELGLWWRWKANRDCDCWCGWSWGCRPTKCQYTGEKMRRINKLWNLIKRNQMDKSAVKIPVGTDRRRAKLNQIYL